MSKVHEVKPEKVAAVADIVEKLKNAQSVVICSYSGLTVEQVTEIRKQCREKGCKGSLTPHFEESS